MGWVRALILVGLMGPWAVHAQVTEIYKCVEPNGRPLYTSDKRETVGKKCQLVSREVNVVSIPGKPGAKGAFPRESFEQRASARERQRDVLQKELSTEEQDLLKAKKELAEQESVRTGEERNYARVQERLQKYKDVIETHEKNIDALKRELSNLNR
jgi:septal ring factor EnvC (AmiA/AmiB activator)